MRFWTSARCRRKEEHHADRPGLRREDCHSPTWRRRKPFLAWLLDDIDSRLDEIVASGAHGLVTTAAGKFYTNGLDLDWLAAHGEQHQWYVGRVQQLLPSV